MMMLRTRYCVKRLKGHCAREEFFAGPQAAARSVGSASRTTREAKRAGDYSGILIDFPCGQAPKKSTIPISNTRNVSGTPF